MSLQDILRNYQKPSILIMLRLDHRKNSGTEKHFYLLDEAQSLCLEKNPNSDILLPHYCWKMVSNKFKSICIANIFFFFFRINSGCLLLFLKSQSSKCIPFKVSTSSQMMSFMLCYGIIFCLDSKK